MQIESDTNTFANTLVHVRKVLQCRFGQQEEPSLRI